MGSGISNNYSYKNLCQSNIYSFSSSGNVRLESQPFSDTYSVLKEAITADKRDGTYIDGEGYRKNPTLTIIKPDDLFVISKDFTGSVPFVIDKDSNIIVGKRNGAKTFRTPHPSLIGGKNPKVKMAGMVNVKKGKIVLINNASGHYKPNIKSLGLAKDIFNKLGKQLFLKGGLK